MNPILSTLTQYVPECRDGQLSYTTFSTAGSGMNVEAKILGFIFKGSDLSPCLTVKTVRDSRALPVLIQSVTNLRTLSSKYPEAFARAVYIDPGLFSAETFVPGTRIQEWSNAHLNLFLETYMAFQKKARSVGTIDMQTQIETLARRFLSPEESVTFIEQCRPHFPNQTLPAYIQHGDITRDNILFDDGRVYIVDYEHAHMTTVPGYDIYNLISRIPGQDVKAHLTHYAEQLGFTYNESHLALFPVLHELLEAQKKSGRIHTSVIDPKLLFSLLPQ